MRTYQNTCNVLLTMSLGLVMGVGSLFAVSFASDQTTQIKPYRFIPRQVVTEVVERKATRPRRYSLWDKKHGTCSTVLVTAVKLDDGRVKETRYISSFKCTPENRFDLQ